MPQKLFRLHLPGEIGRNLSTRELRFQESALNGKQPKHLPAGKVLADLLKRQARRVMADITECPPDTLPAHLARLDDVADLIRHHLAYDLKETAESLPSGAQPGNPYTLADFVACLRHTRNTHRAPAFVNSRDTELAQINHRLELIAGLLAGFLNVPTPAEFTNSQLEDER